MPAFTLAFLTIQLLPEPIKGSISTNITPSLSTQTLSVNRALSSTNLSSSQTPATTLNSCSRYSGKFLDVLTATCRVPEPSDHFPSNQFCVCRSTSPEFRSRRPLGQKHHRHSISFSGEFLAEWTASSHVPSVLLHTPPIFGRLLAGECCHRGHPFPPPAAVALPPHSFSHLPDLAYTLPMPGRYQCSR